MSFSRDIRRFNIRAEIRADALVRAIALELFIGVISLTRVDTGRARGNWQTTIGRPADMALIRYASPGHMGTSETSMQEAEERTRGQVAGKVIYLSNNVSYIHKLEEWDGMVARNMARIRRILRDMSNSVR